MNRKVAEALEELYRVVYAELGADIDELIKNGVTAQDNWYMDYEMTAERQKEHIDNISKKYKLRKSEANSLSYSFYLGAGPKTKKT